MVMLNEIPRSIRPLLDGDELVEAERNARHPEYVQNVEDWREQIDAFQSSGGFQSGGYLYAFPRENEQDFVRRQAMARFHNYSGGIVDIYIRHLSSCGVKRSSRDQRLNAWLQDVNGVGQSIDEYIVELLSLGLVTGHVGVLVDKTSGPVMGPAIGDDPNEVRLSTFASPSIVDWNYRGAALTSVKLLEDAQSIGIARAGENRLQHVIWALDGWARFDHEGAIVNAATWQDAFLPFFVFRPQPLYTSRMLGRPLVDAGILRALYNRTSEEDQVLRDQAFSLLTISVPQDGDVNRTRDQIGNTVGTSAALVAQGTISYQTPDQSVPKTIRDNVGFLIREIYRSAHVRYAQDSRDAESGESIRLQNAELNAVLSSMARALSRLEQNIVWSYYKWTSAQPEAAYKASEFSSEYPAEFFRTEALSDIETYAEAIRMDLGPTMAKRLKKKTVRRLDGDISTEELAQIDREIDSQREALINDVPLDLGDPEGEGLRRAS